MRCQNERFSGMREYPENRAQILSYRRSYSLPEYRISERVLGKNAYLRWGFSAQSAIFCVGESVLDGKTLFCDGYIDQRHGLTAVFALAEYTEEKILNVCGTGYRFSYTERFSSLQEVIDFAVTEYPSIKKSPSAFQPHCRNAVCHLPFSRCLLSACAVIRRILGYALQTEKSGSAYGREIAYFILRSMWNTILRRFI